MQKLSVREFENFFNSFPSAHVILDSVNQSWFTISETMQIKAEFDDVKISLNPNSMRLGSKTGSVILNRVKYIEIEEPSLLGSVFSVVCGDASNNNNNKSYTIIVA